MLLKAPDDKSHQLAALERLAKLAPFARKRQIAEEMRILRAGIKGEQESAYLLDFHFKASRNTAIIHDLRLEVNGRVAQIDHLLLHRTLNIFVLETMHFTAGLKITEEGEFLRRNPSTKSYEGMASPLAQNERHIAVLKDAFEQIDMPTHLGMRLTPVFLSYVLVSPRARIERPKRFDASHVLKADMLSVEDELNRWGLLKGIGGIIRFVAPPTLRAVGRQLVAMHSPATISYAARFGIAAPPRARTVSTVPVTRSPGSRLRRHRDLSSGERPARPAATAGATNSRSSRAGSASTSRARRATSTRPSKSAAGSPGTGSGSARTAAPSTANAPTAAHAPCSS